jgi:hypothetical protein
VFSLLLEEVFGVTARTALLATLPQTPYFGGCIETHLADSYPTIPVAGRLPFVIIALPDNQGKWPETWQAGRCPLITLGWISVICLVGCNIAQPAMMENRAIPEALSLFHGFGSFEMET